MPEEKGKKKVHPNSLANLAKGREKKHTFRAEDGSATEAGIKSGEARARYRDFRQVARMVLEMTTKAGERDDLGAIQSLAEISGKNMTLREAIILQQAKKAAQGDLQSAAFLRDTAGEKPVEKVDAIVTTADPETMAEIARLLGEEGEHID